MAHYADWPQERGNGHKMDDFKAVGLAEGFLEPDSLADPEGEVRAAWQYLHDTRLAYRLQGFFGRGCQALIAQGEIME